MARDKALYLKDAIGHIRQATDILEGATVETISVMELIAAATQAQQASMELNRLIGMKNAEDTRPSRPASPNQKRK